MKSQKRFPFTIIMFVFTWILLCLFSFTQKDLNLTIYNYPIIEDLINWLVNLGYYNRPINSVIFVLISLILSSLYLQIILKKINYPTKKQLIKIFIVIILSGIIAYPAFSHDFFNYLFYPRMILIHKQNPYFHTAQEFFFDPWTRFMHNVHLTNPYGYIWTFLSIIPVFLFIHNFTLSFWSLKILVSLFFILEAIMIFRIAKKNNPENAKQKMLMFLFNPLLLTETLIIGHNDTAMMFFLLLSIYLFYYSNLGKTKKYLFSILTFISSILIKYATVVLSPLILLKQKFKNLDIFTWGGLLLLILMLSRPDQLHSWYLQWGITLLILSKKSWAVTLSIILSIVGLIRYIPFIYFGDWSQTVWLIRNIILFTPLSLLFFKKIRLTFNK